MRRRREPDPKPGEVGYLQWRKEQRDSVTRAPKFGIAIYRRGIPRDEQEPIEVTREEVLALKAFDLVWFFANPAPGEFRIAMDKEKEFTRFLKQWRAGQ